MGHVLAPNPDRGVFKSIDGGRSWNKILFVDNNTGAICLVNDPNHPDVMYAAMWQAERKPWGLTSGGPRHGIYKNTKGGETSSETPESTRFPARGRGRIGLAAAARHTYHS